MKSAVPSIMVWRLVLSTNMTENTQIYMQNIYKAEDKQVEQSQNKKLMKVFIEANNYETKEMHNRERNDNEAC